MSQQDKMKKCNADASVDLPVRGLSETLTV
jgi:hypothetical protein